MFFFLKNYHKKLTKKIDPKPELKNFKLPKPGEKKEETPKTFTTPAQPQNVVPKPPANNSSLLDLVDENVSQNTAKPQQNNLWNAPFQQPVQEQAQTNNNANICNINSYLNL